MMGSKLRSIKLISQAVAIGALLALGGCSSQSLFESNGPSEVGATQIAVTSVTPWVKVEGELQPDFQIDESSALQEVMPTALYSTEQDTESTSLGLSASNGLGGGNALSQSSGNTTAHPARLLPPSSANHSVSSSARSSSTPAKQNTNSGSSAGRSGRSGGSSNSGRGSASGETPSLSTTRNSAAQSPDDPSPDLTGGGDSPDTESVGGGQPSGRQTSPARTASQGPTMIAAQSQSVGGPLDFEPQLRYTLATSLMQYVRLTNHYVQDLVDNGDDNTSAYVVRLQVSLMPLSRTEHYNTYVDLGFFEETKDASEISNAHSIEVVPLLSTDSIEGLMRSKSSNDTSEIALSLQAMISGVGAGLDADKLSQVLKQVSGRDMNSLFTMGRVTDNTLRVRLGAEAQPSGDFAMVPRTYTVPVVLLARGTNGAAAGPIRIRAVSKTVFVNAISGQLLAGRSHIEDVINLPEIRRTYMLFDGPGGLGLKIDQLLPLTEMAVMGDIKDFANGVQKVNQSILSPSGSPRGPLTTAQIGKLWMEALSLRATDAVQKLAFTLPDARTEKMPPIDQTGWMYDDGEKTVVTLYGGKRINRMELQGILEVVANDGTKMRMYAVDEPTATSDERAVQFSFPSLKAAAVTIAAGNTASDRVTLVVDDASHPDSANKPAESRYTLVNISNAPQQEAQAAQAPSYIATGEVPTVDLQESEIIMGSDKGGAATAIIRVPAGYAGGYHLVAANGGSISAATPNGVLEKDSTGWLIKKGGPVSLTLANCTLPTLELRADDGNGHWSGVTRQFRSHSGETNTPSRSQGSGSQSPNRSRGSGNQGSGEGN